MLSNPEIHFFLFPLTKLNPKLLCSTSVLPLCFFATNTYYTPMTVR